MTARREKSNSRSGFIDTKTIVFNDLVALASHPKAREAGKLDPADAAAGDGTGFQRMPPDLLAARLG